LDKEATSHDDIFVFTHVLVLVKMVYIENTLNVRDEIYE
jgi:hypothetical protein